MSCAVPHTFYEFLHTEAFLHNVHQQIGVNELKHFLLLVGELAGSVAELSVEPEKINKTFSATAKSQIVITFTSVLAFMGVLATLKYCKTDYRDSNSHLFSNSNN